VNTRSGIGYDSHRFIAGRPLHLGGVLVPWTHGLAGHSDGDAILHAVVDALLGAGSLGDIGSHFPDTDPQWKGAESSRFAREAVRLLAERGLAPEHVDVTVIVERPKLASHIPAMREATANALGLPVDAVSIKAKTNEGMGWIGRGEGLGVIAVATVRGASG